MPKSLRPGHLLAVNLGKNKTSPADSNQDYVRGVKLLGPFADVLVINVSSPNTPGLRGLQGRDTLRKLLSEVTEERNRLPGRKEDLAKVVVKIAPDLDEDEITDIAWAVRGSRIDGVIVSNTTIKRDGLGLVSPHQHETGGLSGAPVKPLSLLALKTLRPLLPPSVPIIGCGGISDGTDALEFAEAGASIVQAYTAFGYKGVGFARNLKDDIVLALDRKGEKSWGHVNRDAQKVWQHQLDKVGQNLIDEAVKLAQVKRGGDYVPWQDLVAERGMGKGVQDAKAIPFSQSGPVLDPASSISAADPQSQTSSPSQQPLAIADSHRPHEPTTSSSPVSALVAAESAAETGASATTIADTLDMPSSAQDQVGVKARDEQEDTRPFVERESAQLSWVSEVTKGGRRVV